MKARAAISSTSIIPPELKDMALLCAPVNNPSDATDWAHIVNGEPLPSVASFIPLILDEMNARLLTTEANWVVFKGEPDETTMDEVLLGDDHDAKQYEMIGEKAMKYCGSRSLLLLHPKATAATLNTMRKEAIRNSEISAAVDELSVLRSMTAPRHVVVGLDLTLLPCFHNADTSETAETKLESDSFRVGHALIGIGFSATVIVNTSDWRLSMETASQFGSYIGLNFNAPSKFDIFRRRFASMKTEEPSQRVEGAVLHVEGPTGERNLCKRVLNRSFSTTRKEALESCSGLAMWNLNFERFCTCFNILVKCVRMTWGAFRACLCEIRSLHYAPLKQGSTNI
ncbi:hypothetical protein BOTBODRAFT_52690 [Botryobasidium botryosum FD-172 SS1]|uniref:Uncharacterized protein n=1 Tax=Botryobasidium botryosum (strain FD-172 SS1) TaxID=930990 RepID=A0A067MQL7_BOTB1|nr:hypothetical protein BOTBODRAFT_52690 [Botryobasidium botryosum FD-172 SS1]